MSVSEQINSFSLFVYMCVCVRETILWYLHMKAYTCVFLANIVFYFFLLFIILFETMA